MEITLVLYSFLTLSIFIICKLISSPGRSRRCHPRPTPAGALPIIGDLHLLKPPLHRNFHHLSHLTGPIFSLKLGLRRVVVVSSPSLAEECFTINDVVLANRPLVLVDKYIGAAYGNHFRSLRRITAKEVLSTACLNSFLKFRRDEVNRLLLNLHKQSHQGFTKVELRPKLSELTFNNTTMMLAGKRFSDEEDEESEFGKRFRRLINNAFEMAEVSNPQDFLPFLQWIDYGGLAKKLAALATEMDEMLQSMVDQHRRETRNCMIGHLLTLQESDPQFYSDLTIKCLLMCIPRGTLLFVNAWAIHRDPEVWENAASFKPERFEGVKMEGCRLMSFGMGRRACPGEELAQRRVGLALGSMVQCFEWERVGLEEVDLVEGEGLSMPKLKPLQALCRPRQIMDKLLLRA